MVKPLFGLLFSDRPIMVMKRMIMMSKFVVIRCSEWEFSDVIAVYDTLSEAKRFVKNDTWLGGDIHRFGNIWNGGSYQICKV